LIEKIKEKMEEIIEASDARNGQAYIGYMLDRSDHYAAQLVSRERNGSGQNVCKIIIHDVEKAPVLGYQAIAHSLEPVIADYGQDGKCVSKPLSYEQFEKLFKETQKEKAEAQRAEEIISGTASIPRGMDSNLLNAGLGPVQESILSSIDNAGAEIKSARASAPAAVADKVDEENREKKSLIWSNVEDALRERKTESLTFEEVWDRIDGENKSLGEVGLELEEEISQREKIIHELYQSRNFDFEAFTPAENKALSLAVMERDSFIQVLHGITNEPFITDPEEGLGGLEESDVWKAAQAKYIELKNWVKEHSVRSNLDIMDTRFCDVGKNREIEEREAGSGALENQRGGGSARAGMNSDAISGRAKQLQEAQKEKAEAQRAEEIISGAASIPRGMDSNLLNADLDPVQESILSSIDKAGAEIKSMRASAAEKETAAASSTAGSAINAAAARSAAKKKMPGAIVTDAEPGKTYMGKIIAVTGSHPDTIAIQKISGNQAVLHRIKDISAETSIQVGADLSIAKDKNGKTTVRTREELDRGEKTKEYGEKARDR
jgi:hypothetical protein